jgi:hypothetical protein
MVNVLTITTFVVIIVTTVALLLLDRRDRAREKHFTYPEPKRRTRPF